MKIFYGIEIMGGIIITSNIGETISIANPWINKFRMLNLRSRVMPCILFSIIAI